MKDYSKPGSRCIHAWKRQKEFDRKVFLDRVAREAEKISLASEAFASILEKRKPWYRRIF